MASAGLDALKRQRQRAAEQKAKAVAADKALAAKKEARKELARLNSEKLKMKKALIDMGTMSVMRAFRMSDAHWGRLEYLAEKKGVNVSEMVRILIEEYPI